MKVSIEHKLNSTSKEIYEFISLERGVWKYSGIFYSNRNDETDVWGDEWEKTYSKVRDEELNLLANKNGYADVDEWIDNDIHAEYNEELDKIIKRYRPTCNKTLDGRTYYHGISWGYGFSEPKHTPKISIEQIKDSILRQTSNIEIKL
jgi:hypothetical protein